MAMECISTIQGAKKDLLASKRGLIEGMDFQQLQEKAELTRMLTRKRRSSRQAGVT